MTGAVISLIVDGKILRPLTGKSFPFYARERGGQNFPRKTCTLFFYSLCTFWSTSFLLRFGIFTSLRGTLKLFLSRVLFGLTWVRSFYFLIFRKLCRGVAAPAASQHRNNQTIASRWKTVGGNRRKISALNQMQIERSPSGFSLLEIFNFPLASLPAPVCLLPEKQTGIDFLSPRVFPHHHH